jgi:hypothetical protein
MMPGNGMPRSAEAASRSPSSDTDAAENAVDHRDPAQISQRLDELGKVEPVLAEVVDLKFICSFSFGGIAALRGTPGTTQLGEGAHLIRDKAGNLYGTTTLGAPILRNGL